MGIEEYDLRWESCTAEGGITGIFKNDRELVNKIRELLGELDLDDMVSKCWAEKPGTFYVLTSKGYDSVVAIAVERRDSDLVEYLEKKKAEYCFRDPV